MSLITLHVMKWLKLVRYTPIVGAQLDELRQLSAFLFLSLCRCSASVNVFGFRMVIKCLLPGCLSMNTKITRDTHAHIDRYVMNGAVKATSTTTANENVTIKRR